MKKVGEHLEFSATDLVGYLNCRHLADLDRAVAEGTLPKPKVWDPLLEILSERGAAHEQNYIEHLTKCGLEVAGIDGGDITKDSVGATLSAMRRGVPVIAQAALSDQGWNGRADILRRVEVPSALGCWSYEPIDAKLARETKAGTILQLCLYSDLLAEAQKLTPEYMYVVVPWSEFEPRQYRFADYAAYYRKVKRALLNAMLGSPAQYTYPDPIEHCEICRWREACDKRRHEDDHLCLVAGISKLQINELRGRGIATVCDLASMPLPLGWKPNRGSADTYFRIREQARIVVEARAAGVGKFELLPVEAGFGLTRLPQPSEGDVFFDLEGDPFVGEHGLEYLFGYLFEETDGGLIYEGDWALSRAAERRAFETFVDFVMARWAQFPEMHIYHYAPYEPAALKRLMGRYATRQEEIDRMLRAGLFVDLYHVVRHSLRASVESYSIKRLEAFYEFDRLSPLADANAALANLQASLELSDVPSVSEEVRATVRAYNEDDCRSTLALRHWLETLRANLIACGSEVPRPQPGNGAPNEKITDWLLKVNALIERLTAGVPAELEERNVEQQARWILANVLHWHRREDKAVWWEYFRLADLSADELLDERAGLSGLVFVGAIGGTAKAPIHRYGFPPQETEIRGGEELRNLGGAPLGKVEAISFANNTVDIKKRQDAAGFHPQAVFAHTHVGGQVMADALVRIGEYVADHGLRGDGPHLVARDLLLREWPRVSGEPLHRERETTVESAVRLCAYLAGGVLPIQGPPGAGKTFTGARMICELVRRGKTVGITANSHKVIRNLIDATIHAADDLGIDLQCCHKADEVEAPQHRLTFAKSYQDFFAALRDGAAVGGGTAWLWSRPDAFETVDVLFVDEAAQMSLANVLAVSQAAQTLVLIGDPQQLDQPMQGSHPKGTDVSALDHILDDGRTISADQGLFLEETWRLHPAICAYTSELFYDGKLRSTKGLEQQRIKGSGPLPESGLYYLPVEHNGNQNCSPEEAQALGHLVRAILAGNASWIDREGQEKAITQDDIVIITPYNAQVFEIQQCLPAARVGTVDKFQGQEAAIAIYSTATSSHADAPRGMEFLYSLNRLNVATSRAKCVSILVGSPQLFQAECRTPWQIQLVNAFCRYLEMAKQLTTKNKEYLDMNLPTVFETCEPREDVLTGTIAEADFAADLAKVIRGTASDDYQIPARFFANTYPTAGLKNLLRNVLARLTGDASAAACIFRLDTSYGGGKTHGLIALTHAANGMNGVANIAEFIDPKYVPTSKIRIAAFDGENADPANGRSMEGGVLAHTPWGELACSLAGKAGYERVRKSDESHTAPGAETIAELFGGEPCIILLDELSVYLRKARNLHGNAAGEQLSAFLTSLFKAVENNPRVSLVYTLAIGKEGKAGDAYSAENQYIADKMAEAESISARKATLLNPTEDNETVQVLLRRLFGKIDLEKAAPTIEAYRSLWLANKEFLPNDANHPETIEAFRVSYPLHPEVLDTLTNKTATLQNFQRVRGMLRLLARTIGRLWQTRPVDATAIHLHHIDLGFEPIRQELFTKLGRNEFVPAVNHDIAGGTKKPLAVELDENFYSGLAPYTTYTARTVFIHSLAFNDQLKGLSPERLRFSVGGTTLDLSFIDAAWKRFRDESSYLDDRPGVPLRFLAEANLTQVIRREEANVDTPQARVELNDRIKMIFVGVTGSVFETVPFPATPGEVDDDLGNGRPRLAVMAYDGVAVGATVEAVPEIITRIFERKGSDGVGLRGLRNHLVFVVADEARIEEMRKKVVRGLALAELIKPDRIAELADHQQRKVRELEQKSEMEVATAIQQCYRHVFYPSRQRLPGSPVDLAHAAVDIHSASERPGSGQQQIVRTLRESANQKLRLSEDPAESPGYIRDRTPLKKGQISTAALRDEFRKDPALSIHAADSVLIRAITQGIQQGDYVYRRGELLCGPGDPMASIIIDEQSFVFTMQFAKEKNIWPRPVSTITPAAGGNSGVTGGLALPEPGLSPPTPPVQPPPGAITAEGVLKAALTELWERARKAKFAQVQVLSVRLFDATDAFRMLGSVNAEKGCTKQVRLTGGYVTGEGGEMQLEFTGAPSDAMPVKDFLVPQLNAARERDVQATFVLTFNPGLPLAGDAAEKLGERLAKFASGAAYVSATAEAVA